MSHSSRTAVSVLISTYNKPPLLERALLAYERQTFRDFEVIVTDDGSGPETERLIRDIERRGRLRLRHVRQEDRGFRLARVRNLGMTAARGDYIVFTDQDCLAGPGFLAAHSGLARRRRIVQGGRRFLSKRATEYLLSLPADWAGRVDLSPYAVRHPAEDILVQAFARRFGALTGSNVSGFKADFLRAGGFEERYEGWGAEDLDLGYRLWKSGFSIAYLGVGPGTVIHLHHPASRNFLNRAYLRLYRDILTDMFLPAASRFNPRSGRGRRKQNGDTG